MIYRPLLHCMPSNRKPNWSSACHEGAPNCCRAVWNDQDRLQGNYIANGLVADANAGFGRNAGATHPLQVGSQMPLAFHPFWLEGLVAWEFQQKWATTLQEKAEEIEDGGEADESDDGVSCSSSNCASYFPRSQEAAPFVCKTTKILLGVCQICGNQRGSGGEMVGGLISQSRQPTSSRFWSA